MTLLEKRKYMKKYIIDFFKRHEDFSKYYYERRKIDGIDYRGVLIGFGAKNDN